MEPPAGAAPARLSYKGSLQAAARRLWSQSPVLPWTQRAYETCLSAGSTAVLADGQRPARPPIENGAPIRNCTELAPVPNERIAENALGATKLASPAGLSPAT